MGNIYYYALFSFLAATDMASAHEVIPGPAPARVERVIDGDTVRMRVSIWIDQEVTVSVRLSGIDAPELFRPRCAAELAIAIRAKDYVISFLSGGEAELYHIERDKYGGRVVARIVSADGDLGEALLSEGLAVRIGNRRWAELCE